MIKKNSLLRGKTLVDILYKIGFKKKKEELCMFYIINRKIISNIGVYIAKKNIRDSIKRNFIKRRIRNAYNIYIKKYDFLYNKIIIILSWEGRMILPSKEIKLLIKKIFNSLLLQISPNLIF